MSLFLSLIFLEALAADTKKKKKRLMNSLSLKGYDTDLFK